MSAFPALPRLRPSARCLRRRVGTATRPVPARLGAALALTLVLAPGCARRSRASSAPPPAPPCYVDGVFDVQAQRIGSTGSVCNLDDLRQLREEITLQRTGAATAYVHQRGQYAHPSNLDPYGCAVWTDATPTHGRQVLGATVSGHAAYRATVSPDGSLAGTLQLHVQSTSLLVPACTASFNLVGRRIR